MKKIELNNEIVLLRQIVRQARICVVNKLVREAKKLRSNHRNEKQLEKNKHKAEKLLREVFALKRIKDDEISRNSKNSGEISKLQRIYFVETKEAFDVQSENSQAPKTITKVISNEATVKRFVEILQETKIEEEKSNCLEETETQQFSNKTIEMDDFFLNAHNAHNAPTFSSIPMFYEEGDIENLSNVDRGAFKSGRIRSKKGKLYNEKIGKANWNKRVQKMNNKNGFHNGDGTTETSIAYWKENRRKDAKGKERSIKDTNVRENESLHPSWAAKRKQQDILKQGFQGKKIKFEEE
ncbi:Serum response factor-binding protein 1 [Anthophora quadrimaculata]